MMLNCKDVKLKQKIRHFFEKFDTLKNNLLKLDKFAELRIMLHFQDSTTSNFTY